MCRKVVFVFNDGKNRQVMASECYLKLLICIYKNAFCYKTIINSVSGFFAENILSWRGVKYYGAVLKSLVWLIKQALL